MSVHRRKWNLIKYTEMKMFLDVIRIQNFPPYRNGKDYEYVFGRASRASNFYRCLVAIKRNISSADCVFPSDRRILAKEYNVSSMSGQIVSVAIALNENQYKFFVCRPFLRQFCVLQNRHFWWIR